MNGQTAAGDTIDIAAYLKQFCAAGTSCSEAAKTAANAFDKLGPTAAQAAQLMGSGTTAAAAGVAAPIIAGALGGAIGGPAGAAVAATVVTGAEGLFTALFPGPPAPVTVTCDYRVGSNNTNVCFHRGDRPPGPTDPNTGQPDSRWLTMEGFMTHSSATLGKHNVSWQWVNDADQLIGDNRGGPTNGDYLSAVAGGTNWAAAAFSGFWEAFSEWIVSPSDPGIYQKTWNASLSGSLALCGIALPGIPAPTTPYQAKAVGIINRPAALIDPDAFRQTLVQLKLGAGDVDTNVLYLTMDASVGANMGYAPSAKAAIDSIGAFIKVYCQAFYRGVCERFINNWQVDANFPMVLLEAAVQAWNAAHEDTATYTFDQNNSVASFVDAVIQDFVSLPGQGSAAGGYAQTINVGPAKAIQVAANTKLGMNLSPLTFKTSPIRMLSISAAGEGTPMAMINAIHAGAAQAAKARATKELAVTSLGAGALTAFVAGMPWVALGVLGVGAIVGAYEMWWKRSSTAAAPMGAAEPSKPAPNLMSPNSNAALLRAARGWPVGSPAYNRLMAAAKAQG
jgi:hypothetical protein